MSRCKFRKEALFLIVGSLIATSMATSTGDRRPQQREAQQDWGEIGPNHDAIHKFYMVTNTIGTETEIWYTRPEASTHNLHREIVAEAIDVANLEKVCDNSCPSFQNVEELEMYYIETKSKSRVQKKFGKGVVRRDDEIVQLPYAYNGSRAEAVISVDVNGKMFFVTPHSIPPTNKTMIVYIEHDKFDNEYVQYPYRRQSEPGKLCRVPLWVKGTDSFHAREIREYMYEKHGYYLVDDDEIFPEWMNLWYDKPEPYLENERNNEFDSSYKLSISWIPSLCALFIEDRTWMTRDKCEQGKWVVNGLWNIIDRPNQTEIDNYCHWAVQEGIFPLIELPFTLERALKEIMYSAIASRTDVELWTIHYCSHGMPMFNTAVDYFRKIMELFDFVKKNALTENGNNLETDEEIWTLDDFLQKVVVENVSSLIDIRCERVSTVTVVVKDLQFCFTHSNEIKTCPIVDSWSTGNDWCNSFRRIIHQPKYELFPYLLLTLAWQPSQMKRLMQQESKPLSGKLEERWVIHKLCPSQRFRKILMNYHEDRSSLVAAAEPFLRLTSAEFRQKLNSIWPSLFGFRHTYIYYSEIWNNCGLHLTSLRREELQDIAHYLETALMMADSLLVSAWDAPLDIEMDADTLHRYIARSAVIHNPGSLILVCTERAYQIPKKAQSLQHLVKVRACYTLDFTLVACPPSERNIATSGLNQGNCGDRFFIPSQPTELEK